MFVVDTGTLSSTSMMMNIRSSFEYTCFSEQCVVCGAFGLPTAFPCGHRCTVGIDQDPPMCLDAQGGIKAKRQPFVIGVVLKCCGLGGGRRDVLS